VPVAGGDARAARWVPVEEVSGLAFDHDVILRDAVEQARDKLQSTTVATAFCGTEFTIGELRAVYEAVWGFALDKPNFHRKVTDAGGFIEPTGEKRSTGNGRPCGAHKAIVASGSLRAQPSDGG
jgi:8-oxo-dGTP diphosphatase